MTIGADLFVHMAAVERDWMRDVREGQKIGLDRALDSRPGKMRAEHLQAA